MSGWHEVFMLSLAQAYLVYLVVKSSLSLKLRSKLHLPMVLTELLDCPICTGFWIALVLSKGHVIKLCAIGFLGSVFYEAKEKFLPCASCQNTVKPSEWTVT